MVTVRFATDDTPFGLAAGGDWWETVCTVALLTIAGDFRPTLRSCQAHSWPVVVFVPGHAMSGGPGVQIVAKPRAGR